MGIQGLLPLLKSIHKPTHLRNFAGQTLGIDAYGWLHRGTVSCAIELAQQKPTRKHIEFALSRVRMLIHFGVKPYVVFDGAYLPSKEHTEKERAAKRKESKRLGLELLNMGRISQAYLELQKAIDVTPTMARELIEELKRMDVPYVVAPYEADSQLAYLEKQQLISGVISEDSDLLVFGVKCLLTKLDQYGECVMVNRADFTACREISLVGWTDKEFRMMAMLSGCDYLPCIEKMGLKTAYRLVRKHKAVDKVIRSVQFDGKMKVPAGYLEAFSRAERTFLYQWVFCPETRDVRNLNSLPAELENEDMHYIGEKVESEIAVAIAEGNLDPNTKQRLVCSNGARPTPANRSRPVQTPYEKPGKPISEFFKPVRTPLAELDPNSFTPSPSQQLLLESQQRMSWSASQAPTMRPPALGRISAVNGPSSAPQGTRRVHSESAAMRKSPKRQRLCSDSMRAVSMDSAAQQSTTSRFFSRQNVEPSPSLRKPSMQGRKKDDFELWSDDSIVEVLAEIPPMGEAVGVDRTTSVKKRKKLDVFTDPVPNVEEASATDILPVAVLSQETLSTSASRESQKTVESETPLTSFEVDETFADRDVFTKGVDEGFAALKAKCTYQPTSPRRKFSCTKATPLPPRSPLQIATSNRIPNSLTRTTAASGLPKLTLDHDIDTGEQPAIEDGEEITSSADRASPPSTVRIATGDKKIVHDEEQFEVEQRQYASTACLDIHGSEDYLVPNSPESQEDSEKGASKLDLGRFAFAGHY